MRAGLIKFKLQKVYDYKSRELLVFYNLTDYRFYTVFVIITYVVKGRSPVLTSFLCWNFCKASVKPSNLKSPY